MRVTQTLLNSLRKPRHLTSIADLSSKELELLVDRSLYHKKNIKKGLYGASTKVGKPLDGQVIAMIFNKRSTRTRVSTEGAITYLGGHSMFLGKEDIQLGTNETLYDSSRVISSMTSGIVARVGPHSDIQGLAQASSVPIINGLCDMYHPLQAICDMATIKEAFGKTQGLKVAWVGDANNVLHDMALACSKSGISVSAATPKEYPVNPDVVETIREAGDETGAILELTNDPKHAISNADIVVTDTWVSMGQESDKALRLKQFEGYQITKELTKGANSGWKFMHCLPRKPEEVTDDVFYADNSLVFEEAENRLYAAISAIEAFVVNKGKIE